MSTPAASSPPKFLNTSTCLIGATGSGKTRLIATAAEYVWETYGGITALYHSDLGGYPARVDALVRAGIIWLFRMRTRGMNLSFETAQLSSMGYWPRAFTNTLTGEVAAGVGMVGPTTKQYRQVCNSCGKARTMTIKAALNAGKCTCGKTWSTRDSVITDQIIATPGVDKIKLRAYDGLTSLSEWYLQDLSHRKELGGEMGAIGGVVDSGGQAFRGNNRAQVGFAQTRVHELVSNSLSIPGQVIMPIWTAITAETGDESGRLTVVGPKLAGSAKTETAPAWFGNTFEAQVVEGDQVGTKIRRLYLSEFIDAEGRRHLCKHRADPAHMPEYVEDEPYTAEAPPQSICTNFSLGHVFALLSRATDRSDEEVRALYPGAPGIDSVPASFGLPLGEGEDTAPTELEEGATPAVAARPKPAVARPVVKRKPGSAAPPVVETPVEAPAEPEPTQEPEPEPDPELAQEAAPVPQADALAAAQAFDTEQAWAAAEKSTPRPTPRPAVRPAAPGATPWAPPAGGRPAPRSAAPSGTVIRRPVPPPATT